MRSPSSRTADRAGAAPRRAFTTLEILLALALLALVAGIVAIGVARTSSAAAREHAVRAIERALLTARVDAMRFSDTRVVVIEAVDGGLRVVGSAAEGAGFLRTDLEPVGEGGDRLPRLEAAFDSAGRTRERAWTLAPRTASNTIVAIEFDPVSGAPRVEQRPRASADGSPTAGPGTGRSNDAR